MARHSADAPVDATNGASTGLGHYLPQITIEAGNPDAAEVAAVTAVLAATLEALEGVAEPVAAPAESAWQRSQRALREPLRPGHGRWRGFSG